MLILVLVRNAGWPLMLWFTHHRIRREHLMLFRRHVKKKTPRRLWIHITVASHFFFPQQHNKGYKYLIISNASSNICLKADNAPPCYCLAFRPETVGRKSTTTKLFPLFLFSTSAFHPVAVITFSQSSLFLKVRFISLQIPATPVTCPSASVANLIH